MSRGVNKTISIGNCCADPKVGSLPNGTSVCSVTMAMNNSYKDKKTGQNKDMTEFVRVVFFDRLADIAGEFLTKGSKIYVEGSLRTKKWQAQDGSDRYSTEIVGKEMSMFDSRGDSNNKVEFEPTARSDASHSMSAQAPESDIPF